MTAREAYACLQAKREIYPPRIAFFKAAEELGLTPKELSRLFFLARKEREAEGVQREGQLSLF